MSAPAINPILLDPPREIVGERVVLRAIAEEHAAAIWEAVEASREHLKPTMPWVKDHVDFDYSREYTRRMPAKWALREDFPMGIWAKDASPEGGRLLGATGLHRINWSVPSMEIGYWVRPEAQGKGYVTEAVRLIAGMAFEHLCAERVFIMCSHANLRSAAVARRAGFAHEGTLRCERRDVDGTLRDTELFSLTRADFPAWAAARA